MMGDPREIVFEFTSEFGMRKRLRRDGIEVFGRVIQDGKDAGAIGSSSPSPDLIAAYIAANAQREEEWRELFLLRGMGWGRTDEQEARFLALRARLLGEGA
jgi:hypothetical protein